MVLCHLKGVWLLSEPLLPLKTAREMFISTWGIRAMASALIDEGLFRTLLKCSAHLSRIAFLSVSRVVPSALSRGDVPDD